MKKVLTLYRVSTLGQVDPKDDIPMQRRECMAFIDQHSDWEFYGERLEKGVSGYKVSAANRDVILEIKALAQQHAFDILLVFMFDRLGRREDETPFLVQWFIEQGIEVWSTREGQQKLDSRVDKLLNYIRFWQAGGESEKTSLRVKAAHRQMTEDGIWRGGAQPFGYKLVHNGRIGKRERQLYDIEIDETQAPIVREIFRLACYEGYGVLRIANYLNDKYKIPGKTWSTQTIRGMLRNPFYTGRMHMKNVVSKPNESLRIISDEDFAFADRALKERIQTRYTVKNVHCGGVEHPSKIKTYGASLLSGIIYCGHCGHKLVGTYCTKQNRDKQGLRPIYRCYYGAVRGNKCDGQTVYSAKRIEGAVLEAVHGYFDTVLKHDVGCEWEKRRQQLLQERTDDKLKVLKQERAELEKKKETLKAEVMNALMGKSKFDSEMLTGMLEENTNKLEETEKAIEACLSAREDVSEQVRQLDERCAQIENWSEVFETANRSAQKMILARLIKRIEVDRNYHLTIHFNFSPEDLGVEITPKSADNCEKVG